MTSRTATRPARLTFGDYAGLQTGRIARLYHDHASIEFRGGSFVMEGPSGSHVLLGEKSSHERVAAHWATFAAAPGNARA